MRTSPLHTTSHLQNIRSGLLADRSVHLQNYSPNEVLQSPHDISKLSPFIMDRVLALLKHREHITPRAIEIHYVRPGAQENRLWVPISVLQAPDATVHKFAARALLGDLERGKSSMHAKFGEAVRNTSEQTNRVRLQGKALGYKWSLVSKWTSFVAVEEPTPDHELDRDVAISVDGEDRSTSGQRRG